MLTHREATAQDVPSLAAMNRQLIEDEQHPRSIHLTLPQLEERMRGFLTEGYGAVLFERDDRTVGYALFRDRQDSIYLRQFFVTRDCRRQGIGREAFDILRKCVWPTERRLTVEVLWSNRGAYRFWKAVGYHEYAVELEIIADSSACLWAEPQADVDVQVLPAQMSDLPVVENLSCLYIHDCSELAGWACPETGWFGGCDDFFNDWRAGRNQPFVIRAGGELAGFTGLQVVDDEYGHQWDIPEFFILRKFRRRGVGRQVAMHLFDMHPGKWLVRQLMSNPPAVAFWRAVIAEYTCGKFTETRRPSPWGEMNHIRFSSAGKSAGGSHNATP